MNGRELAHAALHDQLIESEYEPGNPDWNVELIDRLGARIDEVREVDALAGRTRLPWVCPCLGSSNERTRSGDITAIAPSGYCRFCGRDYAEANGAEG